MKTISVTIPGRPQRYQVRVERGLLGRVGARLKRDVGLAPGTSAALVTDRNVGRLYAARVEKSLRAAGCDVRRYTVAPGEPSKDLAVAARLFEAWARDGLGKSAVVVALGGGVVSDVAGFAASAFGRGLAWVAVPTTLLAQADAAIGGKTGVNLRAGKNLVGAFHHPRAVYADPDALRTLPKRAIRSGLAEVVKMGVVRDPSILTRLMALARRGRALDPRAVAPLVHACAVSKAWFVSRDERDQGIRRVLNFGHTVGHALEASEGYRRFHHGEAVSVGMVAALELSVLDAGLDPMDAIRVVALLKRLGLPTSLRRRVKPSFWRAVLRDKKRGRAGVRVVLCPAIGKAKVIALPSLTPLERVVDSLVRGS
ncbi:MAG TPA: 3-dehydroquinate synthase [Candidatus Eisenbacteria bacterium]|nr:3-dehydroquinate synthase [Candidatus Eisenbacteria bacterium]